MVLAIVSKLLWPALFLVVGNADGAQSDRFSVTLNELVGRGVRVVYPATAPLGREVAERVIGAFETQAPFPPILDESLRSDRVTISLAPGLKDSIDAVSYTALGTVALRLPAVSKWDDSKLHRVLRHELVHVALDRAFGYAEIPRWFREGLAEWFAGGFTCEAEARVRLHLAIRSREGLRPPGFRELAQSRAARLSYDHYLTIFLYLEDRLNVAGHDLGSLLESAQADGIIAALRTTLALDLEELEDRWRTFVARRYGGALATMTCGQ